MKTEEATKHTFDTQRHCLVEGCGVYHYTCQECGVDCTSGTIAGPATTDTDGIRRCYECHLKHITKVLRLSNAAPDLLEACKFVEDWVNTFLPHQGPAENNLLERVQAAIAKAEGR